MLTGTWGVMSESFFQVLAPVTPPAPTHHATVIVPAPVQPSQPHHVTVVTMGPTSVINTVSTSRQNLDTIVQVRSLKLTTGVLASIRTLEGAIVLVSAGNPAHRGYPGEGLLRRGRAAESSHRLLGSRPLRRRRLGHGLKQRRAWWLFAALSSPATSRTPYTHIHASTQQAQADEG